MTTKYAIFQLSQLRAEIKAKYGRDVDFGVSSNINFNLDEPSMARDHRSYSQVVKQATERRQKKNESVTPSSAPRTPNQKPPSPRATRSSFSDQSRPNLNSLSRDPFDFHSDSNDSDEADRHAQSADDEASGSDNDNNNNNNNNDNNNNDDNNNNNNNNNNHCI